MTVTLPRINPLVGLAASNGTPSSQFMTIWNELCDQLENNLSNTASVEQSLALQIIQIQDILNGTTTTKPDTTQAYTWTAQQTYSLSPIAPGYKAGANQVVGAQQPAIAALAGAATLPQAVTAINAILTAMRTHGLIAP